jgi:subtilisin
MNDTPELSIINPDITLEWLRKNSTGKGVRVAVIDSGIDPGHAALSSRIIRSCKIVKVEGKNKVVEFPVEESIDSFGHGTGVAGIIADLAPDVELVNVKVLNQYRRCTGNALIDGIKWALDQNIKLINMSLTTIERQWARGLFELCEQAYVQDAIIVVSRRNHGPLGWPAIFSSVISVEMGQDFFEKFQIRYKNGNLIECDGNGNQVKVPAPGGGYSIQTGTSFATPHITGIIALMLEKWPDLLSVEVKSLLKAISL